MNYLLDTCVISELIKKHPDSKVVQWISSVEEIQLFISVLTIGELYRGIEKLPEGKKRNDLHWWVSFDLKKRFQHKIINFDLKTAAIWGKIQAKAEKSGLKMPTMDSLIAATGISHDLVVVTRNIKDMESSGVEMLNPWS